MYAVSLSCCHCLTFLSFGGWSLCCLFTTIAHTHFFRRTEAQQPSIQRIPQKDVIVSNQHAPLLHSRHSRRTGHLDRSVSREQRNTIQYLPPIKLIEGLWRKAKKGTRPQKSIVVLICGWVCFLVYFWYNRNRDIKWYNDIKQQKFNNKFPKKINKSLFVIIQSSKIYLNWTWILLWLPEDLLVVWTFHSVCGFRNTKSSILSWYHCQEMTTWIQFVFEFHFERYDEVSSHTWLQHRRQDGFVSN